MNQRRLLILFGLAIWSASLLAQRYEMKTTPDGIIDIAPEAAPRGSIAVVFSARETAVKGLGEIFVDDSYEGVLGSPIVVPPGDHIIVIYYESPRSDGSPILRLTARVSEGRIDLKSAAFDSFRCSGLVNSSKAKQDAESWRANVVIGADREPTVIDLPNPPQTKLHDCADAVLSECRNTDEFRSRRCPVAPISLSTGHSKVKPIRRCESDQVAMTSFSGRMATRTSLKQ